MEWIEAPELNSSNIVKLGGKDPKTGKLNPASLEGYYLGKSSFQSKFNPNKTVWSYAFQTATGIKGLIGVGNLDRKMNDDSIVQLGRKVLVTFTGTVDTGKGNPMNTFSVKSKPHDVIDVTAPFGSSADKDSQTQDSQDEDSEEEYGDPAEDEEASQQTALMAAEKAKATKAKIEALLNPKKAK